VCPKQIFEIFTTVGYSFLKVRPIREFGQSVRFIVMIAVKHDFEAALRNSIAEIFYKSVILVQRMYGSADAKSLGHTSACARAVKGNHGQRDRTVATHFAIHVF
jgi:hypothetical protein